jgi:hypothetical protein
MNLPKHILEAFGDSKDLEAGADLLHLSKRLQDRKKRQFSGDPFDGIGPNDMDSIPVTHGLNLNDRLL